MATQGHVFLSYSRRDADEVSRLHEDLVAAGHRVWWDRDILPAEDWKLAIRQAMKQSYAVVLCLSAEIEAQVRSGLYPEARDAIGAYREHAPGRDFLFPVRLSDCEIPPLEIDATRYLDRIQYVDLFPEVDRPRGMERLLQALNQARSGSGPVPRETEISRRSSVPRAEYISRLCEECNRLRLVGLDSRAADAAGGRSMTLEEIYVSLDTQTLEVEEEGEHGSDERPRSPEDRKPLSAIRALATAPRNRAVLLGLPGSGKSTFVRHLALRLAEGCLEETADLAEHLPGWPGSSCLPVVLPLGRLAETLPPELRRGTAQHVEAFLRTEVEERLGLPGYGDDLLAELRETGGAVLFDGLDEVANLKRRPRVREAVESFARNYPRCRLLVTCRTYSYTDPDWQLAGWPSHELAPLNGSRIDQLIEAWYDQLAAIDPGRAPDYRRKKDALKQALRPGDVRRLAEIAPNPLLLTVMAVVHTDEGELPDARALVYERCVDLLLIRWEANRRIAGDAQAERQTLRDALGVPRITLLRAIQEVAYKAHQAGSAGAGEGDEGPALLTEDLLAGVLFASLGRDEGRLRTFLEYCEGANGLLMYLGSVRPPGHPRDDEPRRVYAFPHLTFQEYLAGRYLGRKPNLAEEVRRHADLGDRWRQVVVLLAEYLCFEEGDFDKLQAVLERLVPEPAPSQPTDRDWRAVWLAGDLLVLLRRAVQGKAPNEALDRRVVMRLVDLLEAGDLTVQERAAAGRTLAALGDPRPGIGVIASGRGSGLPELTWVEVPGGTLRMGSGREDRFATPEGQEEPYKDEIGPGGKPFAVAIGSFRIAAYPVTVAQFRPFVERGGYEEAGHWTQAGWAWREKNGIMAPREWEDRTWHLDNHPVTNVSWFEAVAYCRWVTVRWRESGLLGEGEVIRLPTEAEWEWVARGPEGCRWPWGEEWEEGRCNSGDAGVGRTSAVGLFPGGAGWLTGVQDLSGNVLEWCSTRWVKDYQADWQERSGRDEWSRVYLEEDEIRSFRGGSYANSARDVRGACRNWYYPRYWFRFRGFRCARCLSRSEY